MFELSFNTKFLGKMKCNCFTRQSNGNFDLKFRDPVFEFAVSLFKDISKKKEQ